MGHSEVSPEREIHSSTGLLQQARTASNKQSNPTPKRTRKQETKPRVSKRKEIIMIRAEINDIETKNHTKDQ